MIFTLVRIKKKGGRPKGVRNFTVAKNRAKKRLLRAKVYIWMKPPGADSIFGSWQTEDVLYLVGVTHGNVDELMGGGLKGLRRLLALWLLY